MIYEKPPRTAVMPLNDLREHDAFSLECWCHPIEDEGRIVHNSMDEYHVS